MGSCNASSKIEIRPVAWTERLEAGVRKTATPQEVAWHKRRAEAGEIWPMGLFTGGRLAWTALVALEDSPDGLELVVIGAAGDLGQQVDMTVSAAFEQYARTHGAKIIRFHTVRPGFVRTAMKRCGYRCAEFVLKKAVA